MTWKSHQLIAAKDRVIRVVLDRRLVTKRGAEPAPPIRKPKVGPPPPPPGPSGTPR
jgi:hypothetical protein